MEESPFSPISSSPILLIACSDAGVKCKMSVFNHFRHAFLNLVSKGGMKQGEKIVGFIAELLVSMMVDEALVTC